MTFTVNEIFWSPQGEGLRAGEMSVFIRFTGCNLECQMEPGPKSPGGFDCDTEFASGRKLTADEIIEEAKRVTGLSRSYFDEFKVWIVFSGGEPALQLTPELVRQCQEEGFLCAIETNGSKNVDHLGLDWITVSPKVAEHAIRQLTAHEIKYVRGYGQGIPKPVCKSDHQLISPRFDGLTTDQEAVDWCLGLIRENPEWKLSVQLHKLWSVR